MTSNDDFIGRLENYLDEYEGVTPLPDAVRDAIRAELPHTTQRRVVIRVPWRKFPAMNTYARLAVAAIAVVAIGAVGIAVLRPGNSPGPGQAMTPSPEPSPSATSRPTPSPTSAPPLTQNFTSTLHGISMSYPEGWTAQAATEPWTGAGFVFGEPPADFLYDPVLTDHLFLTIASQPIGDSALDEWAAEKLAQEECSVTEPITVDGVTGLIGAADCNIAAVTTDGRAYMIWLYTSGDEAWLSPTFDRAWFEEVLATVQLHPEDAVE